MPREMQVIQPNRLRELREARGLKARHLAVMLDVGEAQIGRYERGESVIPTMNAKQLVDFLSKTPLTDSGVLESVAFEYLMGWDDGQAAADTEAPTPRPEAEAEAAA